MAETNTPAGDAVQQGNGPAVPQITPEEMAVLRHRLATIDDAISAEEMIERVTRSVECNPFLPPGGRTPPTLSPERMARLLERYHNREGLAQDIQKFIDRL